MAVTAQKIAEMAGVSRGTVDRALHNRGRVNPEVAARIRKIAAELGYKPNLVGQALVRSKQGAKLGGDPAIRRNADHAHRARRSCAARRKSCAPRAARCCARTQGAG